MDKLRAENVAIVGFSENTRLQAPFDDPNWEVWVCNRLPIVLEKENQVTGWDRHFDAHTLDESTRLQAGLTQEDWDELVAFLHKDHGEKFGRRRIVYVAEPTDKMPSAKAMPYDEILKALPRRYVASGIAWEFAMAIALEPKKIALYGIDMKSDEEYGYQRPNCEWMIGLAEGRGIEIVLPDTSALVNSDGACVLYGSPDDPKGQYAEVEHWLSERVKKIDAEIGGLQKTNEATYNQLHVHSGGKVELEHLIFRLRMKRRGGTL